MCKRGSRYCLLQACEDKTTFREHFGKNNPCDVERMHYLAKGLSRPIGVFLGQDKPNKAKANRGQKDTRRTFKD